MIYAYGIDLIFDDRQMFISDEKTYHKCLNNKSFYFPYSLTPHSPTILIRSIQPDMILHFGGGKAACLLPSFHSFS